MPSPEGVIGDPGREVRARRDAVPMVRDDMGRGRSQHAPTFPTARASGLRGAEATVATRGAEGASLALVPQDGLDHYALEAARRTQESEYLTLIEREISGWIQTGYSRAAECGRSRLALPVGFPVSQWRKVPITGEGSSANHREARASGLYWQAVADGVPWETVRGAMPVARCSLNEDGVLEMEPVSIILDWTTIPADQQWWTDTVDGSQVGWTHDGHLVAYDL